MAEGVAERPEREPGTSTSVSGPVQTLSRSWEILNQFSVVNQKLRFTDLVQGTGLPKTTVHRLLGALCALGVLTSWPDGSYTLGLRLTEFGDIARLSNPLYRAAELVLERLAAETGCVTFLCVPDGFEALVFARTLAGNSLGEHIPIGARLALTSGAGPFAILAFSSADFIDAVLAGHASGPRQVDPAEIRCRIAEVRRDGYAVSVGELNPEIVGLGVPVLDSHRRPIAALSIGVPSSEWSEAPFPQLSQAISGAADRLSRALGHAALGKLDPTTRVLVDKA